MSENMSDLVVYQEDKNPITFDKISKFSIREHLNKRIQDDEIAHRTANHSIGDIKAFLYFCLDRGHIKHRFSQVPLSP